MTSDGHHDIETSSRGTPSAVAAESDDDSGSKRTIVDHHKRAPADEEHVETGWLHW